MINVERFTCTKQKMNHKYFYLDVEKDRADSLKLNEYQSLVKKIGKIFVLLKYMLWGA